MKKREKHAEERVKDLTRKEGLTEQAARMKVEEEFPSAFAYEDAKRTVRREFADAFRTVALNPREGAARTLARGSESWNPTADCDGIPAQERAQWLVNNDKLTMSEARVKVKSEFPAAFSAWDANVMCDGVSAQGKYIIYLHMHIKPL